jgi:hypothetical protein
VESEVLGTIHSLRDGLKEDEFVQLEDKGVTFGGAVDLYVGHAVLLRRGEGVGDKDGRASGHGFFGVLIREVRRRLTRELGRHQAPPRSAWGRPQKDIHHAPKTHLPDHPVFPLCFRFGIRLDHRTTCYFHDVLSPSWQRQTNRTRIHAEYTRNTHFRVRFFLAATCGPFHYPS